MLNKHTAYLNICSIWVRCMFKISRNHTYKFLITRILSQNWIQRHCCRWNWENSASYICIGFESVSIFVFAKANHVISVPNYHNVSYLSNQLIILVVDFRCTYNPFQWLAVFGIKEIGRFSR